MKKQTQVKLGSVSHGTLKAKDLIEAFLWELANNTGKGGRKAYKRIVKENSDLLDADGNLCAEDEYAQNYMDDVSYLLHEDIIPALESLAPPFCYFGTTEGDGSDFGFWISQEAISDAHMAGEIWRDIGTKMPKTAKYRLVVSDHGNMTLYYRNGKEVWGFV